MFRSRDWTADRSRIEGDIMTFLKRRAFLGAASTLALPAPAIHAQGRTSGVALVIGNSKYQWEAQLPNVKRDVPDIARRFQEFGLKTVLLEDAGRDATSQAIEKFTSASRGAEMAAIYFAGHGVSWNRATYLVPVDVELGSPNAVDRLLPAVMLRNSFAEAAHHLMVLDNCRNNPADGWRQRVEEGRAAGRQSTSSANENDPPNTIVLFSTIPGRAALDGPAGQNSPFCAALLRQLAEPTVDLPSLPGRLRRELLVKTRGRQVLWDRNNFRAPFAIHGPVDAKGRAVAGGDAGRVVELAGAYSYAQQAGLPVPPGLIGYRSADGRDGEKVGSYKYTGFNQEAAMLIVMSTEDPQNVELLQANRDGQQRTKWRFLRGMLSGDAIEFDNSDQNLRWSFRWSDANSGKLSIHPQGGGGRMVTGSFARLD